MSGLGKRIARARKGVGLSLRELADRVGKSHTAISKYENGKLIPDSATLMALAEALNVRVEFFLRTQLLELDEVEFRTHRKLSAKESARVEALVLEKVERYFELLRLYPQAPIGAFHLPDSLPSEIANLEMVEDVAEGLRKAWKLGLNSIGNLLDELESRGVLVLTVELGQSSFDGLSARVDDYPLIVLGADWPGDRQRFTAAHELGHLVLNNRLSGELDLEEACNRFAGAFLVPRSAVVTALGPRRNSIEPRELYTLKREYGLSMNAWLHRAKKTGVINKSTYDELRRTFRERGWDRDEPCESMPAEVPCLFEQLVYHGLAEEMFGESKAAELLGMSVVSFHSQRMMGSSADHAGRQ